MRMIDAGQVHALLDYPGLIEALRLGHLEEVDRAASTVLTEGACDTGNALLVLPAWQYGRAIGVKVATVFPGNLSRVDPLPSVQAVYVMFDGATGTPVACIDGTALTYRKTAADSALGSLLLSREDSRSLLMVGAGGLAPHVIAAHLAARPGIAEVMIWNRTAARAEALARSLAPPGVAVRAVGDLETAVRRADIVSCATNATEPLIRGAWLKPGCHLDLIGSFTPAMREADDAALARAAVFGDSHRRIREDSGEIIRALASGALAEADIRADLYELIRGTRPGRLRDDEITLFKNAGGSHLDLMTARHLLRRLEG